jgi:hypothetical protein
MTPPDLTLSLTVRNLAAARLRDRSDSKTDWRSYLHATALSPATSRLAPIYHANGDIEAARRAD